MMSFTLVASILYSLSWISVSLSEYQTVEAQPGEEVTLRITNMTKYETSIFWFKLVNRTNASCISAMFKTTVEFCDGYDSRRFEMSSNISTVSLKIKHVDSSDSGLYFCGFFNSGKSLFSVIRLNVKDAELDDEVDSNTQREPDRTGNIMNVTLGSLTVFLMMAVIVLAVKIQQLQKAAAGDLHLARNKNLDFDNLNCAAFKFLPEKRNEKPASEKQVETHVVYSISR
uniref:uncharacterized protein LOC124054979 n=1 Tax=Scatophagus argus TaxID=75038 RepID=UPI001ED81B91|nr:uncharacterized protein LOC124054979 [Scatophagus argus]